MVDAVVSVYNQLGNGHKAISVLHQIFNDSGQRLGGVKRGIVEEDYGAGLNFGSHPLGDVARGEILPVQTVHVPLDRFHAHRAHGVDHMVVIFSVWRAKERGRNAGDRGDLLVAGGEVGNNLIGGKRIEMRMVGGVVHDFMPGVVQRLDRFGVFIDPVAHHEEGDLDVIAVENFDEVVGVLIPPG